MELKKVSQFENLVKPEGLGKPASAPGGLPNGGPSFEEMLSQMESAQPMQQPAVSQPALKVMPQPLATPPANGVKFSNHAVERMQTRGISFNQDDIGKLNEAVGRAAGKGSKDTLVLMNDAALIVSVKNKTVVTVMDKTALKENVFTNIDSTIVM